MAVNSFSRLILLGFFVALLLFAGTFCQADDKVSQVVGKGECADCAEKNIQEDHAFAGLRVSIDCKDKDGKFKCKGEGELDEEGKFRVALNEEIAHSGDDKEECYAQLHTAFSAPCPAHNGLEASKIVVKFDADGKLSFEPSENLKFSTSLCTSATLWPYYKFPPSPGKHSWEHHSGHHFKFPPFFKKPEPKKPEPQTPEPKKPEPKTPSEPKKSKPSAPKKSEPKKQKPQAPKKPFPPSEPEKPKPPVAKSPSEKPPVFKKKPCPLIPKIPGFPKDYHHPKFPYFPLPPHVPFT